MTDGRIENNTCGTNGGGVRISRTATMNISGNPVIKNNTLGTGDSAPLNNVSITDSAYINKSGELTSGAEIGIIAKNYDHVLFFCRFICY